jgi:hypothetical protein
MFNCHHVTVVAIVGIMGAVSPVAAASHTLFKFGTSSNSFSTYHLSQTIQQQGNGYQVGADVAVNSKGSQSVTQSQTGSGSSHSVQVSVNVSIGSSGSQSINASQSVK